MEQCVALAADFFSRRRASLGCRWRAYSRELIAMLCNVSQFAYTRRTDFELALRRNERCAVWSSGEYVLGMNFAEGDDFLVSAGGVTLVVLKLAIAWLGACFRTRSMSPGLEGNGKTANLPAEY